MCKETEKEEKTPQQSTQNQQQQSRVADLELAWRLLLVNAVRAAQQRAMTASSVVQPAVSQQGVMQYAIQQRLHAHPTPPPFGTTQQLPLSPVPQQQQQSSSLHPSLPGYQLLTPNQQAELISQNLRRSIQQRRLELERSMMMMKQQREQATRQRQSSSSDGSILDERKPAAVDRKMARQTEQSSTSRGSNTAAAAAACTSSTAPPRQQAPPPPLPRPSNPKALIHDACRLYPTTLTVVDSALKVDPEGIRRRIKMDTPAAPPQVMVVLKTKQEGIFELPINVALQRNASLDVLRLLIQAGPDVLTEPDGPEQWCSLAHALCKKRKFDVIQLLVQANPDCCKIQDRRSNFPLHIACCVGSSLAVVKLIGSQYPEATKAKNFNGQTPLDICQRNVLCSDAVIDYLQNTEFDGLEDKAVHLDFDDDEYVGSAR